MPNAVILSKTHKIDAINFDKQPDHTDTPLTPGEIGRIYNRISLNLPKCEEYQISFSTLPNTSWSVDIIDILVMDVSNYIWITDLSDYQVIKYSRPGSPTTDVASVELKICAPAGFGNEVRVDVFIRPWSRNNDNKLKSQQSVTIIGNVKLKSTGSDFALAPCTFNVSSAAIMEQYILEDNKSLNDKQILIVTANTTDNYARGPGETTAFTFFIQVPENSKLPNCSVVFSSGYSDIYNESELTILNVKIEFGNIFRTSQREKFKVEYTSKYPDGQNDTASVDFGNLVNPSNFNEQFKSIIKINVNARISDSRLVNNGSEIKLVMTANFGSLSGITEISQVIKRNGNERAIISMDLQEIHEVGKDKQFYGDGDVLMLNLKMKMEQNSSLECSRHTLNIYPGVSVENVDVSPHQPNLSFLYHIVPNIKTSGPFIFKGGSFRFDNEISVKIYAHFKDKIFLPSHKNTAKYTVVTELVCISTNRPEQFNPYISRFLSKKTITLADTNFTNIATQKCDKVVKLTEKQNIPNCSVNSLSTLSIHDIVRGSQPNSSISHQPITILFDQLVKVSQIRPISLDSNNKIKILNISTTTDGILFKHILTMNKSIEQPDLENMYFDPPLNTRGLHFIAVDAEDNTQNANFSVAIYGCKAIWDPLNFDPCSKKFIEKDNENKFLKTILMTKEFIFYCEVSPLKIRNITNEKHCYIVTGSFPITVTDMGQEITEIIMLLKPSNIIVGRNSHNNSTLISENMGKSWIVTNEWKLKNMLSQSSEIINSYDTPWFNVQNKSSDDFTISLCNSTGDPWNYNIRFTSDIFKITVAPSSVGIPNKIIGQLTFRDIRNDQIQECGKFFFLLEEVRHNNFPIYVENSTGFIRFSRFNNFNWPKLIYHKIYMTVKLYVSPNKEMDSSQIVISWNYFTKDEQEKQSNSQNDNIHLERSRRSLNPTSLKLLVTRSDAATNTLCPTEIIALSVQIGLPAVTTPLTVELFGLTKDTIVYGFVEFIDISYIGARVSNRDFSISIRNTTVETDSEYKNTYTAVNLSSVTVIDIPNVVENYSLTLRFAVGLWNNSLIADGMQFICNCKVSDGMSVVTSATTITSRKLCTVYQPELTMLSNFSYIIPGDILLFQAEAYFTFETGNYTFTVYIVGYSFTIDNFEVTLGNGMNYEEGSEVRQSEDKLTLTEQIDVQMKGLRNKNARATYLSKSDRSVKLNAYIQAVTFPSTRAIIGFRFRYSQADVIFREIQIPVIANYRNFINVSNPTFNFSVITSPAKVETFAEVFFSLRLPPLSKQIYAVEIGFDNVSLGEFCYSTVAEVGKGITNRIAGMRLYTEYVTQKLTMLRRMAVINLGVLENPATNNTDHYVIFKIIVRPQIDKAFPTISETQINARVFITGTPQEQQSITFSIVDEPILPITATNSPKVNFYKIEPARSEPMDAYNGILFSEISWVEQVIYSPVKILINIIGSGSGITELSFVSVGRSLITVIPRASNMSITNNTGIITLPSVYIVPTPYKYDNILVIKYSVKIAGAINFTAILDVITGGYTVTSQVNFAPIASVSPSLLTSNQLPYWAIDSLATSRNNNSVVRGAFNLLLFSMTICSGARQTYSAQLNVLQITNIVTFMKTKTIVFGRSVSKSGTTTNIASANNINLNMASQYFDSSESISNSRRERSTITYLVPLNVNLLASSIVSVSVTVQYGIQSAQTYVSLPVIQPEPRIPQTSTSYQIDAISFQDRPYERTSLVAPGQTVRLYNKIGLPNTMCTTFLFEFTMSSSLWPIDFLDAQLVSYSDFIWFTSTVNPLITKLGSPTYNKITMDLGSICVPETYDNQVRIDLFFRPRSNFSSSTINGNITVSVQSLLTVGTLSSPLSLSTGVFVLNKDALMKESMFILPSFSEQKYKPEIKNITNGISFQPGVWTNFTFRVQVPFASYLPDSSIFVGGANSSAEYESTFTVNGALLTFGSNLAGLRLDEFKQVYSSTYMNGQKDLLEIKLGNVVNSGVLLQPDSTSINENDIAVEVLIRLSDSKLSDNGTNVTLPIRVKFGSLEAVNQMEGKVFRVGDEFLNLQMNVINLDENVTGLVYNPNDTINLRARIQMMSNSKMECGKQWLNIYHSMAVKSAEILYSIPSDSVQFKRNETMTDKGLTRFQANGFYFDNNIDLYFKLQLNDKLFLPSGKTEANLTILVELICITYNRNINLLNSCNNPTLKRIMRGVVVKTKQQQQIVTSLECEENLGLSNSQLILPCQITSYMSPYLGYSEEQIRFNSAFGWKPFVRPGPYDPLRYITILFGQQTNVSRIDIILINTANQVTMFHLMGTNDGQSFFDFKTVPVSYMNQSYGRIFLQPKFVSRGIRLVVSETTNENSDISFTLGLYGCRLTLDTNTFDPCGVQDGYVSSANNGLRSYLYADGYLFYCDVFLTTIKSYLTEKRCFVAYNNADMKWTDLGPSITKVLSYTSPSNIIFAQGQNDDSILLSSDYGERWVSTNLYTQVKLIRDANYYINSTIIPWTYAAGYFDQSITGVSCQLYQQSSYHFCFKGIYKNNTMVSDWNRICPALP
ncbi:unnamed protein product [Schistosoma rodhaini]|nr:unnamed protein product [Schistosoma rodhaini]